MITLLVLLFFLEILKKNKGKKALKKSSENDQSTGHFQSFFIYFFFVPPTLDLKKIPVNQLIIWPKAQCTENVTPESPLNISKFISKKYLSSHCCHL